MSESISTSIHTITSISLAMMIVGAISVSVVVISDSYDLKSQSQSDIIMSKLNILEIGYIESTSTEFNIFIKNTGERELGNLMRLSLFFDGNIAYYDGVSTEHAYNFTRFDNNEGEWKIQETVVIGLILPFGDTIGTGLHKIVVVADNGVTQDEYLFSL